MNVKRWDNIKITAFWKDGNEATQHIGSFEVAENRFKIITDDFEDNYTKQRLPESLDSEISEFLKKETSLYIIRPSEKWQYLIHDNADEIYQELKDCGHLEFMPHEYVTPETAIQKPFDTIADVEVQFRGKSLRVDITNEPDAITLNNPMDGFFARLTAENVIACKEQSIIVSSYNGYCNAFCFPDKVMAKDIAALASQKEPARTVDNLLSEAREKITSKQEKIHVKKNSQQER